MPSELQKLCTEKGVDITSTLISKPTGRKAKGDDWKLSAYEFRVTLTYQGRTLTCPFWMGAGHEKKGYKGIVLAPPKPTAADVLYSLVADSSACDETFDDWASNCGYDSDSIKANALYLTCQRSGKETRKLLGSDLATFQNAEH